jgi:predicted transcriptional regulator
MFEPVRVKRMDRKGRKKQIVFAVAKWNASGEGATTSRIAHELKLAVSTKLKNMVDELAKDGVLRKQVGEHWNGEPRHLYNLNYATLRRRNPTLYREVVAVYGEQQTLWES